MMMTRNWIPGCAIDEKLQQARLANIGKPADSGEILLAAPFTDGGEMRGMFVLRVESMGEARRLRDTDPAVRAGRPGVELRAACSAAGLRVVPPSGAPGKE